MRIFTRQDSRQGVDGGFAYFVREARPAVWGFSAFIREVLEGDQRQC